MSRDSILAVEKWVASELYALRVDRKDLVIQDNTLVLEFVGNEYLLSLDNNLALKLLLELWLSEWEFFLLLVEDK
ncbi:GD12191 [Drosophila simulans]|uniref:GD12191 n=1 Tax=Drosophila simulans TaxID=7240 RepID=B4QRY9_DROSI|nr:GD12191 [Drosophila simulans]